MIKHSLWSEIGRPYNLSSKRKHFGLRRGIAAAQLLSLIGFQNNRSGWDCPEQIRTLGHYRSEVE